MSLKEYGKKRDFNKTNEPKAIKTKPTGKLHFVIQKHDASRLHYDFRLEMKGVLKSWAVPKGPSTDPKTKRLAVMVEDHPFEYKNFEGIIPKGEYGGGTVIVWDEGTYEPIEKVKGKKAQEKYLLNQLHDGSLKIILHGKKLKGEYALVKTQGMGENGWLLIKHKDEYASLVDITKKDTSVLSSQTIEQVKKVKVTEVSAEVKSLLKKGKKSKIPIGMTPMLTTLIDKPVNDPNWVYEVKWDGYRALAFCLKNGDVQLLSRNNKQFNEKFYPIFKILQGLKQDLVIDGEILIINDKGISSFRDLQNWSSEEDGKLVYYVFDIIWYEGKDLTELPLNARQKILAEVLANTNDGIKISKVFYEDGNKFYEAAVKNGLEGIIAKRSDSIYAKNTRSKDWLKIKINKHQEVVIAGYTKNGGTSKQFSSLLLGVYKNDELHYVGKVGTGFNDHFQKELIEKFRPLITIKSPFFEVPNVNKRSRYKPDSSNTRVTWLKPKLVCEISFTEVTDDGVFRHPTFRGMRIDKKAREAVREVEIETKGFLNPIDETQLRKVNGHPLKFTHLNKLYWPEDKVTKREMFNYYYQVADYILPHLKERPMSLNRFPGGINSKGFYQKDVSEIAPTWAKTFPHTTEDGEHKEYLLGNDEATLLWMASLGCIEMNPWFSRSQKIDNPDYCVIDLDPDKNTFNQVIEAAQIVKEILDQIEIPCYAKTSGSTGMHIYIPLGAKYSYDQSQMFAKIIVNLVHREIPAFTSLERMIANRKGKMYLDFLQNRPGATIACVYSLRPKPGATVSMPLTWDEVKPGMTMDDFTIFNSIQRIKETGDLFKQTLGKGIDLVMAINKAKKIFG